MYVHEAIKEENKSSLLKANIDEEEFKHSEKAEMGRVKSHT